VSANSHTEKQSARQILTTADRGIKREHPMKKLVLALALAFAMIAGAIAVSSLSGTYIAACDTGNC
jgi:uncharacterized protein involved in exopolysaccharide biosynthesis